MVFSSQSTSTQQHWVSTYRIRNTPGPFTWAEKTSQGSTRLEDSSLLAVRRLTLSRDWGKSESRWHFCSHAFRSWSPQWAAVFLGVAVSPTQHIQWLHSDTQGLLGSPHLSTVLRVTPGDSQDHESVLLKSVFGKFPSFTIPSFGFFRMLSGNF